MCIRDRVNGVSTGEHITVQEALTKDKWDVVTLQQVSHKSPDYTTYMPYLQQVSDGVKKLCPDAKQVIHQTWAYEDGSERLTQELGYQTSQEMFHALEDSYNKAAKQINAQQIPVSYTHLVILVVVADEIVPSICRSHLIRVYNILRFPFGVQFFIWPVTVIKKGDFLVLRNRLV